MELKAASVTTGGFGATLTQLFTDGKRWWTQQEVFDDDDLVLTAFDSLGLQGFLTAKNARLWVNASPQAVSVSCDRGAGHIFLMLDEEHPNDSLIGLVSDAQWIVENGVGFLQELTRVPQETLGHNGNGALA